MSYVMESEVWEPVIGYAGTYAVSNLGRVKSLARIVYSGAQYAHKTVLPEQIMVCTTAKDGYVRVVLSLAGKKKTCTVHRLVAAHFIPNPAGLPQINHLDGNKQNNAFSNLEWCTGQHNSLHAKRVLGRKGACLMGVAHPRTKLIEQVAPCGNVVAEFAGQREAQRKTGFSNTNINIALQLAKPYNGFTWRYKS